jgi:C4-dicarboxylate-specific signal transduction histidine kinase
MDNAKSSLSAVPTKRWRVRLFPLSLVALLPLLAFAGFAAITALNAYRSVDNARLQATAQAVAAAVDAQIGSHVATLQALANSPLLDNPRDAPAFAARIRHWAETVGGWLVVLDQPPSYRPLANTLTLAGAALPETLPQETREALAQTLGSVFESGRPAVSDLFDGPFAARPVLTIIVPIDREGQPRRALALGFPPASLFSLLARQELPTGTATAIVDGRFRTLAHSQDREGRLIGMAAPDWLAGLLAGTQRALIMGPGWTGPNNVYALERPTQAPGWMVGAYGRRSLQDASAWVVMRLLIVGSLAVSLGLGFAVWTNRREAVLKARQQAEALLAGRAEVERLHGGLPAMIFLRDIHPDGTDRLIYRGGDLETVTGWPAATFTGVDSIRQWMDVDASSFDSFLNRVVQEGTGTLDYRFRQPDGSWRPLRSRCQLLGRRPNGTCEIVGYTLDISAEREAQARALAAARLASIGEMATGLAHEIRQPLQSMSLSAELAQLALRKGNAEGADRRLEAIVKQTQRASDLVENLRRFARGTADGSAQKAISLGQVVESSLQLARGSLHKAMIDVDVALGDPAPIVVGDAVLLEQVLLNLLLNARDALATRVDGAPRRIRIAALPESEGSVRLTVADTGGGIAPEVVDRAFEPFVTTKGPDKGTGLGLSICYGLVSDMGGSIEAHNEAEGAVITVTLQSASTSGPVSEHTHQEPAS